MIRASRLVSTASMALTPDRRNTGATESWIAWPVSARRRAVRAAATCQVGLCDDGDPGRADRAAAVQRRDHDVAAGFGTIVGSIGMAPNKGAMGFQVWSVLKTHPEIVDRIKGDA